MQSNTSQLDLRQANVNKCLGQWALPMVGHLDRQPQPPAPLHTPSPMLTAGSSLKSILFLFTNTDLAPPPTSPTADPVPLALPHNRPHLPSLTNHRVPSPQPTGPLHQTLHSPPITYSLPHADYGQRALCALLGWGGSEVEVHRGQSLGIGTQHPGHTTMGAYAAVRPVGRSITRVQGQLLPAPLRADPAPGLHGAGACGGSRPRWGGRLVGESGWMPGL